MTCSGSKKKSRQPRLYVTSPYICLYFYYMKAYVN